MDLLNWKSFYNLIIVSIIICFTIYVFKYYTKLKCYPNGPKPIAFIGNFLLIIANFKRHPSYLFKDLAKNYGDVYTFWLGSKPVVVISEIEIGKQMSKQIECCDRIETHIFDKLAEVSTNKYKTLLLMNISDEFKTLRNFSIRAVRNLMSSNLIPDITHKIVDETVDIIKIKESGKPFVPFKYIDSIFVRLLFELTFNEKIDFNDKKIDKVLEYFHVTQYNILKVYVLEYIPALKIFYNTAKLKHESDLFINSFVKWFNKSNINLINGMDLDSGHSLAEYYLNEKNNNKSDSAQYLTDENIISSLLTLFAGGSDTSHYTFKWILLFMSKYEDFQKRMREEIKANIGNRIPNKSDKEKCDFVNAFICETMRYRPILSLGIFRSTSTHMYIANKSIPKGTMYILNQFSILNDIRYWDNPQIFNPQRFLDTEQRLISEKNSAFTPFGIGKRMCIGDKFAMNMLFLVLTRLLQATDGSMFELEDKHITDYEPKNSGLMFEPKPYKIRLVEIKI